MQNIKNWRVQHHTVARDSGVFTRANEYTQHTRDARHEIALGLPYSRDPTQFEIVSMALGIFSGILESLESQEIQITRLSVNISILLFYIVASVYY